MLRLHKPTGLKHISLGHRPRLTYDAFNGYIEPGCENYERVFPRKGILKSKVKGTELHSFIGELKRRCRELYNAYHGNQRVDKFRPRLD